MRLRLDPTSPTGVSVAPEPAQITYRGAVAGQVGKIDSVRAGTNVTVDTSDPKNPIISATGGGGEGGAVDSVNGQTGVVVLDADDIDDTSTTQKFVTASDLTTLSNTSGVNTGDQDLSALALKDNVLELNNTDAFTPTADYHPATKKFVDDSITAAGGYTDESAQDAIGTILTDSSEIDFTYNDATPSITASLIAGSIDESKLDTSVNASLDLADSATQPGDLATVATSGDYNDLTNKPDLTALNDVVTEANLAAFPATGDGDHVYIAEDTGYMYRWNGSSYTQLTDQTAIWGQVSGTLSNQTDLQTALDGKSDTGHTHTLANVTDVTASAAELNTLDGITATTTELNYTDGVTSSIQTQLNSKISSFTDPNADRIVFWDDSASAYAALTASTGLAISGTSMTVRSASATQTGIVELATDAETTTGTDTTRAITPANLTSQIGSRIQAYDADLATLATAGNSAVLAATTASFLTADETKLDGIEAGADVTDEANVKSAIDGMTLTDVGVPASGDRILLQDASDSNNLKYADFSDFGGGSGSGDVVGPASATNDGIAVYDGTTGKLIKSTGATVTMAGAYSILNVAEVSAGEVGATGFVTAANAVKTNTINERTTDSGVTAEGVLLKDGLVDGRDVATDGTKLDGIEAGADVTDTANVTAAGALMDSEVDADIKTLSLPANTTISTFGASLIDDTDDVAARTTLGLGALATAANINNSNWSGTDLSVANGGTGVSSLTSGNVLVGAGTSAVSTTKAAPTGDFVGTSDTQTLSAKTFSDYLQLTGSMSAPSTPSSSDGKIVMAGTSAVRPRFINSSGTLETVITSENNNISTTEVNTGATWVDGKTIYRKAFTGHTVTAGSATNTAHGLSVDNVIKCYGTLASGSSIPLHASATNYYSIRGDKTNVTVFAGSAATSTTATLFIEYTKT